MNLKNCLYMTFSVVLILAGVSLGKSEGYDPLVTDGGESIRVCDFVIEDGVRGGMVPVRVYLPEGDGPSAVVMFSHGLGGSCRGNSYLGRHWAGRGYVAVFMQHVGSDESVWKGVPLEDRLEAMRKAAGVENFMQRVVEVPMVIDWLKRCNADDGHELSGKLDLDRIGMSGHSFGALTTQAVSGQVFMNGGVSYTDSRIKASIMMSPSVPRVGSVGKAFSEVKIPWMLMTGTMDVSVFGKADAESRLGVYKALKSGDKYEVILFNAEHSAFSESALPGDKLDRNPNHHRVVLALSTAFWDSYLNGDDAAAKWLNGDGVKSVLEEKDMWQKK